MNVTDVGHLVSDEDLGDDKMELASKRENKNVWEISEFYLNEFKKDLLNLNIGFPTVWCKATDHIKEQIDFIKKLDEKGVLYATEYGVYFDTSKISNYGELASLDIEGLKEGARIGVVSDKRNKTDFALWKFSPKDKQRLMEWESPWGLGFPGWHIECSAMAMNYLGDKIDIHCGGVDHIPVHHTNEIAQTETITGERWVNYWMHGEFLVMKNGKMSKSSENFVTVAKLIERNLSPLAYRYYTLNTHYRKQLTFSFEAIESSQNALDRLYKTIRKYKSLVKNNNEVNLSYLYLNKFLEAVTNDLNLPIGISVMWDMINDEAIENNIKYFTLLEMDKILGIGLSEVKELNKDNNCSSIDEEIQKLIDARNEARKNKDYKRADEIRNTLLEMGYKIIDSKNGIILEKT